MSGGRSLSGKKRNPNPKCLFQISSGAGLPREGVGAKNFGMSFETQGNQTFLAGKPNFFGGISRDFCRDIPEMPEKFEKQKIVFNSRPLVFAGNHRKLQETVSRTLCHLACAFMYRPT